MGHRRQDTAVRGDGLARGLSFAEWRLRLYGIGWLCGSGVEVLIDFALDEWRPRVIRRRPCALETFFPPLSPSLACVCAFIGVVVHCHRRRTANAHAQRSEAHHDHCDDRASVAAPATADSITTTDGRADRQWHLRDSSRPWVFGRMLISDPVRLLRRTATIMIKIMTIITIRLCGTLRRLMCGLLGRDENNEKKRAIRRIFREKRRLFKIIIENMTGRQIRRLLYGLLILALFVIVIHSGRTAYWLAKDEHYLRRPRLPTEDQLDYNEQQNLQYLESPIQSLTYSSLIMEPNEISKPQLPWYFKDGLLRPSKIKKNTKTVQKITQVWPKEQKTGDRIENQLMFIPPNYQYDDEPIKTILLYNGLSNWMVDDGQNVFISKQCPVNRCKITSKKSEASNVDAILFRDHFSHPGHRKFGNQVWILYFLESPYHTELITYNDVFNWTATYRHDSDIVTPYERWAYYDPSVTQVERLERNYAFNKTKQVAWFVSNCGAKNGRLQYARELAKYISVDVYGVCGQFKCPRSDKCFQMLERDYKFYLAFENSNCFDYVTEKFFVNGLQHDVLPIVMGGRREDYERIAPKRSYVHVDDYESPKRLAEYLRQLDADDELYNEYFRWKGTGEFIDTKFFCRLCTMLHDDGAPNKHYRNINDWWRGPGVCNNAMPWRRFIESSVDAGESLAAINGD